MSKVIEYCHCNRDLEVEFNNADNDIEFKGQLCLEHCGICRSQDFAVVDGHIVTGERILDTVEGGEF